MTPLSYRNRCDASKSRTPEEFKDLDSFWASQPYLLKPWLDWRVLFSGLTGDGKTLNAVELLLNDWLFRGKPVFSNIEVSKTIRYKGVERTYAAQPLDIDKIYSFDDCLNGAAIFIDEANYWMDCRRSQSNQNIYIADIAQQTRKRKMSLIFTVMFPEWIDPRLRQINDVCGRCRDLSRTYWGEEQNIREGLEFGIMVEDWSGKLTGESFWYTNEPCSEWTLKRGKSLWDAFNSYNFIDSQEARNSRREFIEKETVIGKNQRAELLKAKYGEVELIIDNLKSQGVEEIRSTDLWKALNIDHFDRRSQMEVGDVLNSMGINNRQSNGKKYYIFKSSNTTPSIITKDKEPVPA